MVPVSQEETDPGQLNGLQGSRSKGGLAPGPLSLCAARPPEKHALLAGFEAECQEARPLVPASFLFRVPGLPGSLLVPGAR